MKKLWDILRLTGKKITDPFYAGGAAEVAFFLILSLVPTTILLAQLLHVFTRSLAAIRELMPVYLSDEFQQMIAPLLNYSPSAGFSIVLIVLALWAGSKALFSLMRMSNYAYKGGSGYKNLIFGYVKERFRAIITICMVLITLVFALYILVFGEVIVRSILYYLNDFLQEDFTFSRVWYSVRWIIALILYFFMVLSIYYMLPNRESTIARLIVKGFWRTIRNFIVEWVRKSKEIFRMIVPGSVFAAIGMLFATWLYSIYMKNIALKNFNILYGGLSSVVILLIWFYLIAFILIIGIQLNAAYAERKTERKTERKGRKRK